MEQVKFLIERQTIRREYSTLFSLRGSIMFFIFN